MRRLRPSVEEEEPWVAAAREELARGTVRLRTLLEPFAEAVLSAQHSPLMSPIAWDIAHVANYEEQWLVRALGGSALTDARTDALYDAFRHPRRLRTGLPLMGPAEAFRYAEAVRERTLQRLSTVKSARPAEPGLLAGGFVYGMVAQHAHQHVETILATLQLARDMDVALPGGRAPPPPGDPPSGEVRVPGGSVWIGSEHPWAYDNERPVHRRALAPFHLDRTPVTNAAYARFVESGGYHDARFWTKEGWQQRLSEGWEAPLFWRGTAGGFERRRFATWEPLPPNAPVCHVSWYEADAYARWAGRRLPTELEWEAAASGSADGIRRTFPWGEAPPCQKLANLWPAHGAPADAGAVRAGASVDGALQLIGDVWEWTASDFEPYPGFRAFPYREYSEVFFGPAHKVLRGGSWAVAPVAIRNTFRNWDLPARRQIFAGFRCARDADRRLPETNET